MNRYIEQLIQIDDWDEKLLCMMNRNDQRDEPDF
jgi:hypothetical protein